MYVCVCVCVCMYVCVHTCVRACVHVCDHICMTMCTGAPMHGHACGTHMHVGVYTCMCKKKTHINNQIKLFFKDVSLAEPHSPLHKSCFTGAAVRHVLS